MSPQRKKQRTTGPKTVKECAYYNRYRRDCSYLASECHSIYFQEELYSIRSPGLYTFA